MKERARRSRRRVRKAAPSGPASPGPTRSAQSDSAWTTHRSWLPALMLVLAVLAAYEPVLTADFVNWDDPLAVMENPRVTEPDGLLRSWSTAENPEFLPLTYTTFWLEWHAAGGAPWLFHLDNVLLHAASAVLVGLLAIRLGLPPLAGWLVAAVWALHPIQVASVAWVIERKNVLSVVFWLASLLLYLRWRTSHLGRASRGAPPRGTTPSPSARGTLLLSVAFFGLAVLSKRAAMTLPATLVLVEWAQGRRLDGRFWRSLAPYVAVGLAAGVGLLQRVPENTVGPSLAVRLPLACRALWFYVTTFLWPVQLLPVYPRWSLTIADARNVWAVLATGLAAAVGVLLWRRVPRLPMLGLGIFLSNVVLVIGIVWFTFFRYSLVADHLAYLPSLGLALALVASVYELARALHLPARGAEVALAVACIVLGVLTWRQVPIWHDSERLWTSNLARNPDCLPCHINLGMLLFNRGDVEEAGAHLERALALEPDAKTLMGLGSVRMAQGRLADAQELYERSLRILPDNPDMSYNLGNLLRRQGKTEEAIARYDEALRLNPRFGYAHHNLGLALLDAGRPEDAKVQFEEALRLSPGDLDAEIGLAMAASKSGDNDKASELYESILRHESADTKYAVVRSKLAESLREQGRLDEAIVQYRAILRLDPRHVESVSALATALMEQGKMDDALRALEDGVSHTPDSAELAGSLAWIRATSPDERWRNGDEAVRLAERACDLTSHQNADLLDTLAAAYAEAGRFADAARTERQVLDMVDATSELAADLRTRSVLYEAGTAYREE